MDWVDNKTMQSEYKLPIWAVEANDMIKSWIFKLLGPFANYKLHMQI